jgi:hypothetical protein
LLTDSLEDRTTAHEAKKHEANSDQRNEQIKHLFECDTKQIPVASRK